MVFKSIQLNFEKDIFDKKKNKFTMMKAMMFIEKNRIDNYKDYYLTTISNFILGVVTL